VSKYDRPKPPKPSRDERHKELKQLMRTNPGEITALYMQRTGKAPKTSDLLDQQFIAEILDLEYPPNPSS